VRILLLEDDADLRRSVARFLRRDAWSVDETRTLDQAGLRLAVNEYDVLVFDRTVPGGDALGLLRAYRAEGGTAPCLLLTARDAVAERVEGLVGGADDYVIKPFAMEELLARLHVLARRVTTVVLPVVRVADVEVDAARHLARRRGVDLALTPKEFAILHHLAAHADRVVSRHELIEHCWDEFADPLSNVVDVKIRQLRRKLGAPDVVHTVRGAGYRIGPEPP
jgi:two-component system copper resistance phosphate regulon response regulator CusR